MRLGTLQLSSEWDEDTAQAITTRFKLIEETLTNLTHPPIGHAYGNDIAQLITITATGTPVDIDGLTEDYNAGFEFNSGKEFKCLSPGYYFVIYSISFKSESGSQHIEFSIAQNGTWDSTATSHVYVANANEEHTVSGHTVLTIQRDDTVKIQVQNETSTGDVTIEDANFYIMRVAL